MSPKGDYFFILLSYYFYILQQKNSRVFGVLEIIFEQTLQGKDYGQNFSVIIL